MLVKIALNVIFRLKYPSGVSGISGKWRRFKLRNENTNINVEILKVSVLTALESLEIE